MNEMLEWLEHDYLPPPSCGICGAVLRVDAGGFDYCVNGERADHLLADESVS